MPRHPARLALVGCLVLAALLLLADLRGAAPAAGLRGAAAAVAGPPERALAALRTTVGARVAGADRERARIAELEAALATARAEAAAAAAGQLRAEEARELAAGLPATGYRPVPGRVVALSTPQDQVRSATISVGSRDGVRAGLAVVEPGGLVGLVASVGPGVATVRLLVDPAMALAARVAATREAGLVRGAGDAAALTLLDPLGAMAVGDLVVTMGTPDRAVPADVPIGRIAGITGTAAELTRRAAIAPGVDVSTLDRVVVLVPDPDPAADPGAGAAP
ncbi:MAG: rod shape-determining protein MreC [Candidatus Nanopelagicales bacterium]|jgi:rod shape-determining protein MreC|nr:rod shape-determining protein MreC [Candidatus Nanopelagicales bacterium]